MMGRIKGKVYRHVVVPLGIRPDMIERNVTRTVEKGWTLQSTYIDPSPHELGVMGIFEQWEKR